jgi:replication factor C subunit 3/5
MLLVDKYRVRDKEDVQFHRDIYERLLGQPIDPFVVEPPSKPKSFVHMPNLLIHGPPGSGKRTLIKVLLKEIYGEDVERISKETYSINGYGNTSIDVEIEQSNYHLIIEPNNSGFDKYLIQEIVNEYAKRKVIQDRVPFKVVLINNVDNLSYYAQTSLRCTMERYHHTCKFILCGYQVSKIIDPLRSRCLNVRVPHPNRDEILQLVLDVCIAEDMRPSLRRCQRIVEKCQGNVKVAMWMLEMMKNRITDFELSWKGHLQPVLDTIYQFGVRHKNRPITHAHIQEIRNILNTILITNITGTDIMVELLERLVKHSPAYPDDLLSQMVEAIAVFETRLSKGKRSVIHLESLILELIYLANSYK